MRQQRRSLSAEALYSAAVALSDQPVLPEVFKEQLSVGGRLIAILGTGTRIVDGDDFLVILML